LQLGSALSAASFWPTLTAWKFIPNTVGTPGPGAPSCLSPWISLRIALTFFWSFSAVQTTLTVASNPSAFVISGV
jgi:hypothetical protein